MKLSRALLASLVFAGTLSPLLAQKTASSSPKPDYSAESYVFEHLDRVFTYAADGTGVREISGVIDIRNEAAVKALSVLTFPFASSAEHVEITYVRVRRGDGTILSTPASDAQELPTAVTREAPFYSDLKEEQIPVRSLREGDHLEYKIRIVRTKPEAPNHFWGADTFFTVSSGVVILSETLELHFPRDSYAQVWSPNYKSTETDTPTEHVYRWQSSQLEPVAGKNRNALLRLEKDPTIADETEPRLPHVAWTNFHTWAEVGAWYRSMEGSRTEPDDDIRAKVKELTAGKDTEDAKARAIYAYVGPQIRYIGVAFGVGRYQPHQASEILSNQYGDCKDKTTLLISMLAAAGIRADAVLIGAGVAFNEAVPSPASFNHAINLAHVDGKPVWLDATAEVAPYGLLLYQIRGKKALVIPLSGDAHVETTPRDAPFPSSDHFEATGTLDDKGTSHSHITLDFRGDEEVPFRQAVRSVSPAQWDELMQRISEAMSFAGKVSNAQFSRADDTTIPFHVEYDYVREKSGDWDNLRILPQLPPVLLGGVDEKDPPVSPIALGQPHTEVAHAAMQLPAGWTAELPTAIHAHAAFATLDKTYRIEKNAIITDRRVEILAEKLPASEWRTYQKWFKDAGLEGETYIQLVPGSGLKSAGHDAPENNAAAADLGREADQLIKARDWAAARKKLDEEQAINPHQPYLWSQYGYIAANTGNAEEGITDYKRELADHPGEGTLYVQLAFQLMAQKRPDEAIATLQTELDRKPTDAQSALYLASIQEQRSDNVGAEKTLRAGLLASPDNLNLKMQLGIHLLRQHKKEEGEPILRDVVSNSNDPGQLNNAAYELADATLDLPLAEKAAGRCLDLLDEASNTGETGTAALQRASLLTNVWDTYGWILYREDKLADAEPWVRAAWRNGNAAEVGYHLAVILQKTGHAPQALAQLKLAAAGLPGTNTTEVKGLIDAMTTELQKAGTQPEPAVRDARTELQNQRTYELSHVTVTGHGERYATVDLDVTAKGTTAMRFVSGDQSLESVFPAARKVDLHLDIPAASHASLQRRGILSCHSANTCQLVLIQPQFAITAK
jgi:transglutaminase-like putative cysteine protease/tetratricopeptide (TPR) repeat protein